MSKMGDIDEGKTIFLRNVPFEISENNLKELIEAKFGKVEYAKIVISKVTQLPKGVAFVKFQNKDSVEKILLNEKKANEYFEKNIIKTKKKIQKNQKSIKTFLIPPDIGIQFNGRRIYVYSALSRAEIESIEKKKQSVDKSCKLRSNLELIKQGLILPGMKEAEGISEHDLKLRVNSWKESKIKVSNPNYEINKMRLCIRNIPTKIDQNQLGMIIFDKISTLGDEFVKKLVNDIISEFEENNILEKENVPNYNKVLQRLKKSINSQKKSKSVLKSLIRKVRIIRKDSKKSSKSMGYGFINTCSFFLSKAILNIMNNDPFVFTNEKRPIVEFAIEDKRALYLQKKNRLRNKVNNHSDMSIIDSSKVAKKKKIGRGKRQRLRNQ